MFKHATFLLGPPHQFFHTVGRLMRISYTDHALCMFEGKLFHKVIQNHFVGLSELLLHFFLVSEAGPFYGSLLYRDEFPICKIIRLLKHLVVVTVISDGNVSLFEGKSPLIFCVEKQILGDIDGAWIYSLKEIGRASCR